MPDISTYTLIIASSIVVIVSYFYGIISEKTNIPVVLMLLITGILIHEGLLYLGNPPLNLFPVLEFFGIIGLIMIVLEASLDLKLGKDKSGLIIKSFLLAFFTLVISSLLIAFVLKELFSMDLFNSLLYSIPLSIMSSAIVIPSVSHLPDDKKEFMIYESTISDILGIMFFYLLIQNSETASSLGGITVNVFLNIIITLIVSVVASYILIYIFHKLESEIRMFLLIAVLILLYATGKMMHLSSLLIILAFGLILNNRRIFLRGVFKRYWDDMALDKVYKQLQFVTAETSFVVRTFFFVIFGMTIVLKNLFNINIIIDSLAILLILIIVRWVILKLLLKKDFTLELLIAPRGLITILLFFNIPEMYVIKEFDRGILLFIIIISNILMAIGMIKYGKNEINNSNEMEVKQ